MLYLKKIRILLLFILFLSHLSIFSQELKNERELYNSFDSKLGKENLLINNGLQHRNYDVTYNNEHRYFKNNEFLKGDIIYDNQPYFDIMLKYDILKDELIMKSNNDETKYLEVNLIKDKIEKFNYNNKIFINLSNTNSHLTNGFYEEAFNKNTTIFYIKHFKDALEIINEDKLLVKYTYKNKFILKYQNNFYEINKKSDLYKIFPELKKEIETFYTNNNHIEDQDKIKFYTALVSFIYNSKQNDVN